MSVSFVVQVGLPLFESEQKKEKVEQAAGTVEGLWISDNAFVSIISIYN